MRQKGFTLVELLVALAVGSVVLMSAFGALNQVVFSTIRTRSQAIALNDVNFAAARIKEDIRMAMSTGLIDENPIPQSSLTLTWLDYTTDTGEGTDATLHSCIYTISGTELLRTYDGAMSIVGRNITSIGFTRNGKLITCSITAIGTSVQERSMTLVFSVRLMPDTVWE